jgi:hypothetical protein
MNYEQIVDQFINQRRRSALAEMSAYRRLPSLRHAIRDAALCRCMMQPGRRRHPHQWRIPGSALRRAERALQLIINRLARSSDFEALHEEIARAIGPIPKIGDLAIYDIAHRIGAYLGKSPRLVHLHRGTARGARHLGFTGTTLDPKLLPPTFPGCRQKRSKIVFASTRTNWRSCQRTVFPAAAAFHPMWLPDLFAATARRRGAGPVEARSAQAVVSEFKPAYLAFPSTSLLTAPGRPTESTGTIWCGVYFQKLGSARR